MEEKKKEEKPREKRFRISWFNYTWHILLALWLLFLGIYPNEALRQYGLISTAIFIILIVIIARIRLEVIIKDDKLVIVEGIISKHVREVFLRDIRTIDIRQNIIERIFGFGDVMIATSATSGYEIILENIGAPYKLKQEIEKARAKMAQRD
ncbi:PH domain-containing protein [bacterium 3DAC]|nr:PH domain-containing protein [Dictyoglomota bacterium]UZN23510.1 PH domain-containing protein [bacterium 3DAC]